MTGCGTRGIDDGGHGGVLQAGRDHGAQQADEVGVAAAAGVVGVVGDDQGRASAALGASRGNASATVEKLTDRSQCVSQM